VVSGVFRRGLARMNARRDRRFFFDQTQGIFDTPPLSVREGPVPLCIVTQLLPRDIQPYLLCIKALYRRIGYGQVMVLADRFAPGDYDILRAHIPDVTIQTVADIQPGLCQKGGTWERLWTCVAQSSDHFVVQMDADVLALGRLEAVASAIRQNQAFALGGRLEIAPAADYVQHGRSLDTDHINIAAERSFADYPDAASVNYIRASSGFAGFARGGAAWDMVEGFHSIMHRLHGGRWLDWGSEQVASNFVIANTPGAQRLPFPDYMNFLPHDADILRHASKAEAIHFLGAHRYQHDMFTGFARAEIRALRAGAGQHSLG